MIGKTSNLSILDELHYILITTMETLIIILSNLFPQIFIKLWKTRQINKCTNKLG
ncbi:hypothetical protein SShM2_079 [Synechococcus phage S-ShM2]|uniref:Uncharacterized protein n=2 Tax=Ahtivirus sagseatwo TaxID=2734079 RepID=A0A1D7SHZ5_9CAUD|nr:hypothetical protein SShM2_079 [Synechococcus phage S-ShM2]AOO13189.1 hypothetical protein LIS021110_075 [Cyanophage S-RIM14]ADO97690.1 hypothetical protein SShM2_079 [Synechococcus phage S-ShM2]AOO13621.1 hypothetical protein Np111211_075 [Cyanophage S-RIM14]AOO13837.1 hypothetical protein Np450711_075 [Cyanophage S-RIM14]AOO14705.1 hypothetical protein Sn230910_075 [Cyanophage S-RIM14]